MSEENQ